METYSSLDDQDDSFNHNATQGATERILRLLQFLLANECTRDDIFHHLSQYYVSLSEGAGKTRSANKMFERDLKFLERQGFTIKRIRTRTTPMRYSLVKSSGPETPFLFTSQEVDHLALLYNLFADPTRYISNASPSYPLPQQQPRHPFSDDILSLIERFAATLPTEQKKRFNRWVRKPYLYFNLTPVANYLPHRATIDIIIRAITLRQQIRFAYISLQRENALVHEHIDPYYVTNLDGHFYLIAYAHKTATFLEYRIDRIQEESLKIEPAMIDVERRRHPIEFCFWIDSTIAKRGLSLRWLTQKVEREETSRDEQGKIYHRVLVRATAYNEWRVVQQLLKYGSKVELVEPTHLREQMKQEVKKMYNLYSS